MDKYCRQRERDSEIKAERKKQIERDREQGDTVERKKRRERNREKET